MQEIEIHQPTDDREFNRTVAKDRMFLGMFAENQVAADLYLRGYRVMRPLDGVSKYDLVADISGRFVRIQVKILSKTYQVQIGTIRYTENRYDGKGRQPYVEAKYDKGDFDVLALVDRDTKVVYYVPVGELDFTKTNLTLDKSDRMKYNSIAG